MLQSECILLVVRFKPVSHRVTLRVSTALEYDTMDYINVRPNGDE